MWIRQPVILTVVPAGISWVVSGRQMLDPTSLEISSVVIVYLFCLNFRVTVVTAGLSL